MVRNYVYVSYGISFWIQDLKCQNPQIKDRQYLQIIWEGKAKWNELMFMFPTEFAAESNT